jgi:hypothetical protein
MAEPGLIDEYLGIVEGRLAHRRDVRELLDEMADHLFESVERAQVGGMSRLVAERAALDRFGDPHLTATLLASVPTKGFDMKATLAVVTGALAALAWLVAMATFPQGFSETMFTWTQPGYFVAAGFLGLAVGLTGANMVIMNVAIAGRLDRLGAIVVFAAIVATLFAAVVPWVVIVWGPALAVCLAITLARAGRTPQTAGIVAVTLFAVAPLLLCAVAVASIFYEGSGLTFGEAARERADIVELVAFQVIAAVIVVGLSVLTWRRARSSGTSPATVAAA